MVCVCLVLGGGAPPLWPAFFFWIWVELSFPFALLWFGFVLVLADVKFWQGMVAVRFPPLGRANASGSVLVCKS
jgi:hypothetical protein